MSMGIYVFLRIYFLGFGVSVFAQFRTHCADSPAPPPSRSSPRGLSGIECRPVQRVQRPGVCAGAWSTLLPVVCSPSGRAGGLGYPPAGHTAATQPRPVSAAIKFFKEKGVFQRSSCQHPPHLYKSKPIRLCKSPKIPKITKRPLSRSNLCYT